MRPDSFLCILAIMLVAALVQLCFQLYRLGCYSTENKEVAAKNKRKSEYMKDYYTKNKELISGKKKQYYLNKREVRLAYQKDYYQRVVKAGKDAHR